MTSSNSELPSPMGARGSHEASRNSGSHVHLGSSYEPLVRAKLEAVDAEDIPPIGGAQDTDVWLTEWQVGDDGFDVALGEHVDWALVPMDQAWSSRLFAGRRTVLLQRDSEAGARGHRTDWTYRSGRVVRIDQVSVRYRPSQAPAEHGLVPETGGAMQHSVRSLWTPRAHHGQIVGWIVRLRS